MAYNKQNLKHVRELLASRRSAAISLHERRRMEFAAEHPEIIDIERGLALTGARIMGAALSHELTDEALAEIRRENEQLRRKRALLLTSNGYPADWFDIKYNCQKCSDTGYEGIEMCSCMRRELTLAGFASSGLATLIESQSFENFSLDFYSGADRRSVEHNFECLRTFAENFDKDTKTSWLLLGATGLGKTHLSTSVAKVVIERGYDVVYESAQGMISDFEAVRFGRDYESRRDERYAECDLLIIDDLGTEVSNQFTVSCIYNVLTERINKKLPTIINTNLSQSEIRERYADRITSRLFGEYRPLLFSGVDIRRQKIGK